MNAVYALRAELADPIAIPAQPALRDQVTRAVRRYLHDLGDNGAEGLYELVLREIEAPLLSEVLRHYGGNQSRAADALGINRATLRKKLRQHGLG